MKKEILAKLMEPFPEVAINGSLGVQTGKGYDTAGYETQFMTNRLNEVMGLGSWKTDHVFDMIEQTRTKTWEGKTTEYTMYIVTCEIYLSLGEWVDGEFKTSGQATGIGSGEDKAPGGAKKKAFTSALKKAFSMLSLGWQAYAGVLEIPSALLKKLVAQLTSKQKSKYMAQQKGEKHKAEPKTKAKAKAKDEPKLEENPGTEPTKKKDITNVQIKKIISIIDEHFDGDKESLKAQVQEEFKCTVNELTFEKAVILINALKKEVGARPVVDPDIPF